MDRIPDHPMIRQIERTGYPWWAQDEPNDGTVKLWFDFEEGDDESAI